MRIVIINGSPKGDYSVTLQYARYIEKHYSDIECTTFQVGRDIKTIEKNMEYFDNIINEVKQCDCVLWIYPVYTFLVPYQLVKFIDIIFKRDKQHIFKNKYTSQISTSKHFYDHTAYNYIHNICEDLNMKHIHGHCADMDDLTTPKGRKWLLSFAEELTYSVKNSVPVTKKYESFNSNIRKYNALIDQLDVKKENNYKIVLLTDNSCRNPNLSEMIQVYVNYLPNLVEIINIEDLKIKGGCLGCFNCAFDGNCIYKDEFQSFHSSKVLEADCVIIAAKINRHWFNPIWKCYDDRQFYNGHRTSMMGKSIGYILSGPLKKENNLREILEARSQVGQLYLVDIVTDEYETDDEITLLLQNMAEKTMWAVKNKPQRPVNFYGVGGMKIFRDLIYIMKGMMQEDHRFYKNNGLYDFPQKQKKKILQMKLIGQLMKSKKIRSKMRNRMKEGIIKPYKDAIDKY